MQKMPQQIMTGLPNQLELVPALNQGLGCRHHECRPIIPADEGSLLEHFCEAYLLTTYLLMGNNVCLSIVKVK
uniref:Uncharacterized protein n=2 Tax=Aegilops tauschii subsp. strangulata TaxID=200361 RepID=A0A453L6R5_AEGTS